MGRGFDARNGGIIELGKGIVKRENASSPIGYIREIIENVISSTYFYPTFSVLIAGYLILLGIRPFENHKREFSNQLLEDKKAITPEREKELFSLTQIYAPKTIAKFVSRSGVHVLSSKSNYPLSGLIISIYGNFIELSHYIIFAKGTLLSLAVNPFRKLSLSAAT